MKFKWVAFMALSLSVIIGCGQTATPDSARPVTGANAASETAPKSAAVSVQDFAGRTVSFQAVPQQIVALSSGEMDIVYALGGQLVGRPTTSAPLAVKEAEKVQQIGTTHGIDLEKIALVSPDLVLGNHPMNTKDIPSIESIGAKMVLTSANSVEDIKKQIALIGQLLQKDDKARELIGSIDKKLTELQHNRAAEKPRVLLVYGAPGTYMAALNNSLSGDMLVMAGGENIAADYPKLENYPQYAQLNTEKIIQSDPQLILLMSHGNPETVKEGFVKEMQQNAAWTSLDAVKQNRIEVLPSDLFGTNPGTRVIEALDLLQKLLQSAK
ncbi:ABC transporter substrate-binding protein [Paenibacillus validus]|uniref:ABC transporter substrate-binding protein n=1 Tax=Paenibacillus TaxID=44249 RepID=UPI000FD91C4C|nr:MULTISPECIES: ABC transporter substrate-binding protein [Paenibacillus]MED4600490.1 ABC transporter substrate-binding protein [Paenibacillus validus]MED4604749.1 ABC transporter substrate-binding protein [Paenibacillus validus]